MAMANTILFLMGYVLLRIKHKIHNHQDAVYTVILSHEDVLITSPTRETERDKGE